MRLAAAKAGPEPPASTAHRDHCNTLAEAALAADRPTPVPGPGCPPSVDTMMLAGSGQIRIGANIPPTQPRPEFQEVFVRRHPRRKMRVEDVEDGFARSGAAIFGEAPRLVPPPAR